jgi:hypothetical protein
LKLTPDKIPAGTVAAVRCVQVSGPGRVPPDEERQVGSVDIYPEMARRHPRPTKVRL